MGRRLIVDTNVLVAIERGADDVLATLADDDEIAVAAVTVAELLTGVELAPDAERARARRLTVEAMLDAVEVLDCSEATASCHAGLLAHTRRTGRPRGAHDLLVAAHAVQTGRPVLSRDARARFGDLPGVVLA